MNFSPGGYNYLQVSKPGLNIPLDAHMVQPEYVSTAVSVSCIFSVASSHMLSSEVSICSCLCEFTGCSAVYSLFASVTAKYLSRLSRYGVELVYSMLNENKRN